MLMPNHQKPAALADLYTTETAAETAAAEVEST